jgi:uncharacterized protein with PQ loop repeat
MPFDYVTAIGFVAGALTTIALFPQVIKTWKIVQGYFSHIFFFAYSWFVPLVCLWLGD